MDPGVLSRVQERMFARRVAAEAEMAERRRKIYEEIPRIADIDVELSSTAAQILRASVSGGEDYAPKMAALRSRNIEAQMERAQLLAQAGYPADALEVHRDCPVCGDTGYLRDGSPCQCLIDLYSKTQIADLESRLPVKYASFETFDESLYPDETFEGRRTTPRENACAVRDFCRELAVAKTPERSLFLYGGAGVGKTFLGAATAVEASKRGKSVHCRSMSELVSLYEREKFTYDDDTRDAAQTEIDRLMDCDLLIIDNLGSEFRSPFVASTLMGVLTVRLGRNRPLMVLSGIGRGELESRYSPQVESRLLGDDFFALPLYGPDLRRSGR